MKRLLILFLFMASYAHAEIYTWTDKKGTKHYTNSTYDIPERYRARAKALDLGIVEKKEGSSPQQDAPSQSTTPVQRSEQVQPLRQAQPPEIKQPGEHPVRGQQGKRMRPGRPSEE